jgi:hypothetical protein
MSILTWCQSLQRNPDKVYHESAVGNTRTHPPLRLFSSRAFLTILDNSCDNELGVAARRMAAKRLPGEKAPDWMQCDQKAYFWLGKVM